MLKFLILWLQFVVQYHCLSVIDGQNLEKGCTYEERIWEVEQGSFTPLVFSCSVGMGGHWQHSV